MSFWFVVSGWRNDENYKTRNQNLETISQRRSGFARDKV